MTISEYCMLFIIYSFFGWLYESMFYTVQFGKPVNTGFLHGCVCPIYGLACVGNVALLGNETSGVKIFIISTVVISGIEYVVSWVLENRFSKRWWDYSEWPLNINGRISLISSTAFGVMSYIQLRFIEPPVYFAVTGMSQRVRDIIILLFIVYVVVDLVYTLHFMDRDDDENDRLWFVGEESRLSRRVNERLSAAVQSISDRLRRR